MADTFTGFSLANAQLEGLRSRRNEVGQVWAEQLRPQLQACTDQMAEADRTTNYPYSQWDWALFDANKKLLLGKVASRLAPALFLTELPVADLVRFQQGLYQVVIVRPISDDPEKDKWLQLMKGPGITSDHE